MEIIKQGDVKKALEPIIGFYCEYCGCVFEANRLEYTCESFSNYSINENEHLGTDVVYYCTCPTCKRVVLEKDFIR